MGKSLDIVVAVLRAVGLIIVAIVVIYIVLAVGGANPANGLVSCFQHAAGALSLGTVDLFVLKNPKIAIGGQLRHRRGDLADHHCPRGVAGAIR